MLGKLGESCKNKMSLLLRNDFLLSSGGVHMYFYVRDAILLRNNCLVPSHEVVFNLCL